MSHSHVTAFRGIALALATIAGTAGLAGAQTVPSADSQSAAISRALKGAFAAARTAAPAGAQPTSSSSATSNDEWNVAIYPVFAWIPVGIGIDVTVPPGDNGEGGGSGEIIDSRFDGAFLGGFYVSKDRFRVDADGLWAGIGGDRPERPALTVDVDAIYFHVTGGVRLVKDLYVVGGVRRLALKYNIRLADFPEFERKPGVWDPIVGVAWHTEGARVLEFHAVFEGGGFGAGTDVEYAGSARVDFKPLRHFGLTAGYSFLYFKLEDTVRNRTFSVKQTLHGPIVGIGLYF